MSDGFYIGQRIRHPKCGTGEIVEFGEACAYEHIRLFVVWDDQRDKAYGGVLMSECEHVSPLERLAETAE